MLRGILVIRNTPRRRSPRRQDTTSMVLRQNSSNGKRARYRSVGNYSMGFQAASAARVTSIEAIFWKLKTFHERMDNETMNRVHSDYREVAWPELASTKWKSVIRFFSTCRRKMRMYGNSMWNFSAIFIVSIMELHGLQSEPLVVALRSVLRQLSPSLLLQLCQTLCRQAKATWNANICSGRN